jgi:hypothetical protein
MIEEYILLHHLVKGITKDMEKTFGFYMKKEWDSLNSIKCTVSEGQKIKRKGV